MSKRIESVDVAKGIAIICIVLGHLGFSGPNGVDYIARLVFQFHVPIFYIIAGFFLSQKETIGRFIVNKAIRLLVPYAFACLLMLIALAAWKVCTGSLSHTTYDSLKQFAMAALYGAGSNSAHLPEGIVLIGAIWFLEALFVALLEVRLCLKAGRYAIVPIIALFVAAVISSNYLWLPFNIQSGLIAGFYVYCGHILRIRKIPQVGHHIPLLLALVVIAIIAYYAEIDVSLVRAYLGPYYLGIPVSIASSCLVVMLSDYIAKGNSLGKRFLTFFGVNSLAVLCIHIVLLNCGGNCILELLNIPVDYNIRFFVSVAAHLSISALFIVVVQRSKLLSRVF